MALSPPLSQRALSGWLQPRAQPAELTKAIVEIAGARAPTPGLAGVCPETHDALPSRPPGATLGAWAPADPENGTTNQPSDGGATGTFDRREKDVWIGS